MELLIQVLSVVTMLAGNNCACGFYILSGNLDFNKIWSHYCIPVSNICSHFSVSVHTDSSDLSSKWQNLSCSPECKKPLAELWNLTWKPAVKYWMQLVTPLQWNIEKQIRISDCGILRQKGNGRVWTSISVQGSGFSWVKQNTRWLFTKKTQ